ncbi:hypothetical protein GP5015_1442 [gamma proteobacterium HTCC5015]|nr:hypothetical protein GP5015_1442 [gamma proteobacterium HTCC5015]
MNLLEGAQSDVLADYFSEKYKKAYHRLRQEATWMSKMKYYEL